MSEKGGDGTLFLAPVGMNAPDGCALGDFAGASSQEREMFRFNAGISTRNDG